MDSMNKNYDELSSEEKEASIELCKDDPATFIETVLGIELLEYQKVYVRETFEVLKKQDKFDWRARYIYNQNRANRDGKHTCGSASCFKLVKENKNERK